MVVLPTGSVTMGASDSDPDRTPYEMPSHRVSVNYPLAVGRYELTFAEWNMCAMAGGCRRDVSTPSGHAQHPVVNISWQDAQNYLAWLKKITGFEYRLLTEAEWEYAARANHQTRYAWGNEVGKQRASCSDCLTSWKEKDTFVVGAFPENDFNIFEMQGNVREWVSDCWHENYEDAPQDGSAWLNSCSEGRRVTRGGAWNMPSLDLRVSARGRETWTQVSDNLGFRIARVVP
jgi:formylglycine-generating enzyme required for sulfatase activity